MLKNLNDESFRQYGSIDRIGFDHAAAEIGADFIRQREVSDKTVRFLFCNQQHKTALDILEGTAILYIGAGEEELEAFLLDKAVIINQGQYYFVLPLLSTAKISVACLGNAVRCETPVKEKPAGIESEINPERIFTLFDQNKEAGFHFKGEVHDFWELTYVESGTMYNIIDGNTYPLPSGSLMLFLPGEFHSQYADDGVFVRYITITFSMSPLEPDLFSGTVFQTDSHEQELIAKILDEYRSSLIYSGDLILCYLKELLIHLIRALKLEFYIKSADDSSQRVIEGDIVRSAKKFIRANLHRPIAVPEIAKAVPVSEGYFSAVFKKKTGMTPVSYIRLCKLEAARQYIREGHYSFTQIAELLGFGTVHYFSAQFKRQFSMTPSEYKKICTGASRTIE